MENKNGSKIFFLLLLVVLTLAVVGIILYKKLPATNVPASNSIINLNEEQKETQAPVVLSPEQLTANYEQQAKSLLKTYWDKIQAEPLSENLPAAKKSEWQKLADNLQDKFLGLKVPAAYKDLHLQLVLDFNSLSQGLGGDYKLAREAQDKIADLGNQYSWLK